MPLAVSTNADVLLSAAPAGIEVIAELFGPEAYGSIACLAPDWCENFYIYLFFDSGNWKTLSWWHSLSAT